LKIRGSNLLKELFKIGEEKYKFDGLDLNEEKEYAKIINYINNFDESLAEN
jgi:hypothetical protein